MMLPEELWGKLARSTRSGTPVSEKIPEAVEKLPITACGPRLGLKNACFGPLKPDFEPPEPVYAAMNVPKSSFSTASPLLGSWVYRANPPLLIAGYLSCRQPSLTLQWHIWNCSYSSYW
jgi:hypothetical protein